MVVPRHLTFDGKRILMRTETGLLALDAENGKMLWRTFVLDRGVGGGEVKNVQAIRVAGAMKRKKGPNCIPVDGGLPLLLSGGKVYAGASGAIRIVEMEKGDIVGGFDMPETKAKHATGNFTMIGGIVDLVCPGGYVSPDPMLTLSGKLVYVMSNLGLHACYTKTGKKFWTLPMENLLPSSPVISDGVAYLASGSPTHWKHKFELKKKQPNPKEGYFIRAYKLIAEEK